MITAEVVFLRGDEGGRSRPPIFDRQHKYMPHIVIQSRDVRRSQTDPDGVNREPYQGVAFLEGSSNYTPGEAGHFVLELMYYPDVSYADVLPGATFTVREGGKVVGHGVVLSRTEPAAG
jgi:translation elongation factor EF-Tu-like GTPase